MRTNIKSFILRYGVFTIAFLMLVGINQMAKTFTLREKVQAVLFKDSSVIRIYIPKGSNVVLSHGDSLSVMQTECGDFTFVVDSIRKEELSNVYFTHPISKCNFENRSKGNTNLRGYILYGKTNIVDLIMQKISM